MSAEFPSPAVQQVYHGQASPLTLSDSDAVDLLELLTLHIERRRHQIQEVPPWMRSLQVQARAEILRRLGRVSGGVSGHK